MSESRNSGKDSSELADKAVELRVSRLIADARARAMREMAEKVAAAMLLGESLDEFYFDELESLDGVEEAVRHVIGAPRPGHRGQALSTAGAICHGGEEQEPVEDDRIALRVRAALGNPIVELGESVKRAAADVKAKQGADLWVCTRERIADLIRAEMLPSRTARGAPTPVGPSVPGAARTTRQVRGGLGPTQCRRLGLAALVQDGHRAAEAADATSSPAAESGLTTAESRHAQLDADDYVIRGNGPQPSASAAIEEYQRALAIDPAHVMAHFFLAQAFQDAGNLEAAVAEFQRVTQLAPDDPDGHWCLGEALEARMDSEAAATEYAMALKLAPGDESLLEQYSLLDPWMKNRVRELVPGLPG